MGAKESKSKITNNRVYDKYIPTLVDYVDLKFKRPYRTLLKIEVMRCKFILEWNDLLRKTGTITLKDGKFYYVLQSILLNLGYLTNGKLSDVNLSTEEPFIIFEVGVNVSVEMLKIIESYRKLLIFVKENERQIFELDDEVNLNVIDSEDLTRNPDDILLRQNVAPIKILSIKNIMKQNLVNLKKGQIAIAKIKAIVEDIRRSVPDFINKYYYGEEMQKIEKMIATAKSSKNIFGPAKLVYKFINQPKLIPYEDHQDVIDDDIKSEREAREILAGYFKDEDANKALTSKSNALNNIQKSIAKEKDETIINYSVMEPIREHLFQSEIGINYKNSTIEPQSGLAKEIGLESNKLNNLPRLEIPREQQEILIRVDEAGISDLQRLRELPLEMNKSAQVEKRDEIKKEISEIEKKGSKEARKVKETVKVEMIKKRKKKIRSPKAKKNKSGNEENIDINLPPEEINIKQTQREYEEKPIPTYDEYDLQKQAFKNSEIKNIKVLSTTTKMRSETNEFRAEEKLNESNNTLDIYNLYLKDIYINPASTKTVIKSIIEIPEESLIVTGSDTGEVRIFQFNKSLLQKKSEIATSKSQVKEIPSLKLIREIKVFDSAIKSMVFFPSGEYLSYFNEINVFGKTAENLKIKYYLVCSCLDGQISLIDLVNFNVEKIYHGNNHVKESDILKQPQKENNEINKIKKYDNNESPIKNQFLIEALTDKSKNYNLNKEKEFSEQNIIENFDVKNNENNQNCAEEINVENFSNNNQASDSKISKLLFLNQKANTINLPIYSMVFIPNRKTILFSHGTDILEFNNFLPIIKNENTFSNKNKSKINILIPEAHNDEINLLYLIKEKNILVSCSKDNQILLWDFDDKEKKDNFTNIGELLGSTSSIRSICSGYIEGVWHIASLSKEGIVNFWNLENKEKAKTIKFPFFIKSIQFSGYENIFIIIKKSNGFVIFDVFEDQYKEYCNMDKINKDMVAIKEKDDSLISIEGLKQEYNKIKGNEIEEDVNNFKLNVHPNKKIENFDFEKLDLLSLRLMSKYTCGILVGNNNASLENETDVYFAIFANKLGNLDVWANFDEYDIV